MAQWYNKKYEPIGELFEENSNKIWDIANRKSYGSFIRERFPGLRSRFGPSTSTGIDLELGQINEGLEYPNLDIDTIPDTQWINVEMNVPRTLGTVSGSLAGVTLPPVGGAFITPYIIGGGVAAAAGGAIYVASSDHVHNDKEDKQTGIVLPGHHYIGPGNEADSKNIPVDKDDAIAREHDKAYAASKTAADIRRADEVAIQSFHDDWVSEGNLHSLIGRVGLQTKHAIETYAGVLYPSLPSVPG